MKKKTLKNIQKEKEERKLEYEKSTTRIVYWSILLVLVISNFVVSVVLIPFLLIISTFKFLLLVASLGFVFGLLFDLLLRDLEHLKTKHHLFAAILIPTISVVNLFLMIGIANRLVSILKIGQFEDPVLSSLIYVVAFMLPYVFNALKRGL